MALPVQSRRSHGQEGTEELLVHCIQQKPHSHPGSWVLDQEALFTQ